MLAPPGGLPAGGAACCLGPTATAAGRQVFLGAPYAWLLLRRVLLLLLLVELAASESLPPVAQGHLWLAAVQGGRRCRRRCCRQLRVGGTHQGKGFGGQLIAQILVGVQRAQLLVSRLELCSRGVPPQAHRFKGIARPRSQHPLRLGIHVDGFHAERIEAGGRNCV
jgi:hypothetical protein